MKLSVRVLAFAAMLMILAAALPAGADPAKLTKDELKAREMRITDDYVNMRGGYAGTAGHKEIINWGCGLMKNEKVYFLEKHGNWYYVCRAKKIDGVYQCGWVWGDYVKFADGSTAVSTNASSGSSGHVGGTPASETTKKKLRETSEASKVINSLN